MNAFLVRVGIDSSSTSTSKEGSQGWNAPVDESSGNFIYVPIPENESSEMRPGYERAYRELVPVLETFFRRYPSARKELARFNEKIVHAKMHLDPDFERLTYGDRELVPAKNGIRKKARGVKLRQQVEPGDLMVFYAGLRSVQNESKLIYSLIGIFEVEEKVFADSVPRERWHENAHTRRVPKHQDFIFRAKANSSGRLRYSIPIGGIEERYSRVKKEIHDEWGGLDVKDRYIQRGSPFRFKDSERFYKWFKEKGIPLIRQNNP